MRSGDETILDVPAGPFWFKVTGMLEQNWCTIVDHADGKTEAVFLDDLSSVFDRLLFDSRCYCERGLRFNGFTPLDEDPQFSKNAGEPSFPLRESFRNRRPVYSSGEYWQVPPETYVYRPVRRQVRRPAREGLDRFVKAQEVVFDIALSELRSGRKMTHWMWFILPQIWGLGTSGMSRKFGIASLDEARDYLDHPLLGDRLMLCMTALHNLEGRSARDIFGETDALKFQSCLTLFAKASAPVRRRDDAATQAMLALIATWEAEGWSSKQRRAAMLDYQFSRNPMFIFEALLLKYFDRRSDAKTHRLLDDQTF